MGEGVELSAIKIIKFLLSDEFWSPGQIQFSRIVSPFEVMMQQNQTNLN